jgi:beta-lactam-binding protein with PASTA domain
MDSERTPTFAPSSPVAKSVTMPDLVGENASVAAEKLKKLGFTRIEYGSADDGDVVVLLPQNWTVKTQSPKAGEQVSTGDLVVLTCTKK